MPRVKVGNVEIVSLLDVSAAFPMSVVFADVPPESWRPYAELYPGSVQDGMLFTNFQAFAIRSSDGVVLVDMGAGPGPHEALGGATGQLRSDLQANGIDPADVTHVLFTHLHFDHTGWSLVDGRPFCPNARYLAPVADWDLLGKTDYGFPPPDALHALHDAGRIDLVGGETVVSPAVTIVPTPGHTPGHQSVAIVSDGQHAMIAGDLAPTQAVLQETDWVFAYDADPAGTIATRNRVFAQLEEQGVVAAFGHFVTPNCIGRVVRENGRRVFKSLQG